MLTWGPTFFENAFSVLKFLKVIFSFILHPLILRKSMCYGSRRGPLPNNTSCHLIAKLRRVIIILGGPTGRSPGSPTGQSAPAYWVLSVNRSLMLVGIETSVADQIGLIDPMICILPLVYNLCTVYQILSLSPHSLLVY